MAIHVTPRHFTGLEQAASQIESDGLFFLDAHISPDQLTPTAHVHPYPVELYILEGIFELHEPETGLTHRLEPGTKAVVPADTPHAEYSHEGFRAAIGLPADPAHLNLAAG
jgi:quercetin dioxygenase-like cupin family protein